MPPARVPQDPGYVDRRKERDNDRRRSQAQGSNVVPPSPALVRHGSKQRKIPAVLSPGQLTAHPPQVHIPIGYNKVNGKHPYASYEYAQHNEPYKPYGRVSPMVPSTAVSNVLAMGGETGVPHDQDFGEPTKPSFLRLLTCRC